MSVQGCIRVLTVVALLASPLACKSTAPKWWSPPATPAKSATDSEPPATASVRPEPAPAEDPGKKQVQEYLEDFSAAPPAPLASTRSSAALSSAPPDAAGPQPDTSADAGTPERPSPPVLQGVSITAVSAAPPAAVAEGVLANTPPRPRGPAGDHSIQREIEALERSVKAHPDDLKKRIRLRYLYLSEGLTAKALAVPEDLDAERAEALLALMRSVIAAEKAVQNPQQVGNDTLEDVGGLHDWALHRASLEIGRLALCTSIQSFGSYDAVPEDFFVAGGQAQAYLYCELRNFASERTAEGRYRTRIGHRLELFTVQGQSVWKDASDMDIEDVCLNRRRDFFFNRLVHLPAGLEPGPYVLKVTVEDRLKSQTTEASLSIDLKPAGYARR